MFLNQAVKLGMKQNGNSLQAQELVFVVLEVK